jgi:hypothetical protein
LFSEGMQNHGRLVAAARFEDAWEGAALGLLNWAFGPLRTE